MTHDVPVRVDHVGIAVPTIADAQPFVEALGGTRTVLADGAKGDIRWAFFELGDASGIELIEPLGDDSFLHGYLDEHGPGLHHVTLDVADVEAMVEALEAGGIRVVDVAHHPDHGYSEAFVSPRNPTRALFQLMEFHDRYHERYGDDDGTAFVGGSGADGQAEERTAPDDREADGA